MLGVRWYLSTASPLLGEEEEEGSRNKGGVRCDERRREEGEEQGGWIDRENWWKIQLHVGDNHKCIVHAQEFELTFQSS